MRNIRVCVLIPQDLLQRVQLHLSQFPNRFRSRNAFIRQAVKEKLEAHEPEKLREELRQGYLEMNARLKPGA